MADMVEKNLLSERKLTIAFCRRAHARPCNYCVLWDDTGFDPRQWPVTASAAAIVQAKSATLSVRVPCPHEENAGMECVPVISSRQALGTRIALIGMPRGLRDLPVSLAPGVHNRSINKQDDAMYPVNRRKFVARGLVAFGAGALASAAPGLSYADIDYPKSADPPDRAAQCRRRARHYRARLGRIRPRPISAPSRSRISAAAAA